MATTRKLLGLRNTSLTARDAWSATFEHIFTLSSPRTDNPSAPEPPAPSMTRHALANAPLNDLHKHLLDTLSVIVPQVGHAHVGVQKEFGPSVQRALDHHRQHMKEHHHLRRSWRVVAQPPALHAKIKTFSWVNGSIIADNVSVNSTSACLDVDHIVDGAPVSLGACAAWDAGQKWEWGPDATIRLANAPSYCLATPIATGKYTPQPAYIAKCGDNVSVHWAVVQLDQGSTRSSLGATTKWQFYFSNAAILAIV